MNTSSVQEFQYQALLAIAEAQSRVGQSKEAAATFAQARQLVGSLGPKQVWTANVAFTWLVTAMARAGMTREALETAQSYGDPDARMHLVQSIAETQAKEGKIREARETAQHIPDEMALFDVLLAIVRAQAKAGLIDDARKTAEFIKIDSARAQALASIAAAEAKAGRTKQAADTFGQAITLAEDKKYDEVLASIGYAQAKAGLAMDARKTVDLIKDQAVRAEALAWIAEAEFWVWLDAIRQYLRPSGPGSSVHPGSRSAF